MSGSVELSVADGRRRRSGAGFRRMGARYVAAGVGVALAVSLGVFRLDLPDAAAAASGLTTVSSSRVQLTQPADNLLGRMTPTADAATKGMYAPQVGWGVIPVNASLSATGHLITYGTPLNTAVQGGLVYDDWDPAYGTVASAHTQTPSMSSYDSFCNNLVTLPDGRMLMVGGNGSGGMSNMTMYYDPATQDETMGPGLNRERWYATALRRPDDKIVIIGGGNYYAYTAYQNPNDNSIVATAPEIGDGTGKWTVLTGANSVTAFGARDNRWWYPRAYNAPDGSVFGISGDQLWKMSTTGSGSLSMVGTLPTSMGVSGSSVMYAPGKILVAGGGEVANGTATVATNAATMIDINSAMPKVSATAPLSSRRQWNNLTVLPTGEVFANGGTIKGTDGGEANSAYTAEVWNPTTKTWRNAATATRIRTYHSTSVLLPSGVVFTGGGGVPGPEDNFNAEMYYPSYLFTKDAKTGVVGWANRPKITSIAGSLTWGGKITLGSADNRTVSSVSLINAGSVTHAENTDQRRIPLTYTQNGTSLTVSLPSDANQMPPGTYELTVTDSSGVPSPSQLVTLRRGAAGQVNVFEPDQSAGRVGPSGTVVPGVVPLKVGTSVGLQATDDPDVRVRTSGTSVVTGSVPELTAATDRQSAAFVVRAGLAGKGVSLESALKPGSYLTASGGSVTLKAKSTASSYATSATFLAKPGLQGNYTSFSTYANANVYLRKQNGTVVAGTFDGSDDFRRDATFGVRPALGPSDGYYTLINKNSALPLGVEDNGLTAGTLAVQDTPSAAITQTWQLRPTDDGHYKIVDAASGLALGIEGMSAADGGQALVWDDNGSADHLWDLIPRDGSWVLQNVNSAKVLGITEMKKTAGAVAAQGADSGTLDHLWTLKPAGAMAKPGTYTITNQNSGLRLDTSDSGTQHGVGASQAASSTSTTQRWKVIDAGNGTYQLLNVGAAQVLGVEGMSTEDGANVLLWDDNGSADHLWRLVPQNGRWLIVNVNSNQTLGIRGASVDGGAAAVQWPDSGAADHLWTLAAG